MKKLFRILLWIIIAVIFIGTFVYLWSNSTPDEVKYEIVTTDRGTIERTTVLTGKIEPRDEIEIKPQISGIITKINVEPGDMVKEGDVIAIIKIIPEASSLSNAENRVNVARITLEDAKLKYDRNTILFDKKIISKEEFETSQAEYNKAKEELSSANDAVRIVRQGVSQYNTSEANTQVRATITGLVLDVPVKVGTSVIQANTFNDGTTIATIADMNNLIFKGNVDETEVGSLKLGMPMTITIGAIPDYSSEAVIEYISPKGVETNGANTFELKAAITPDPNMNLRAGYSANANVALSRTDSVLRVPERVVEFTGDSTFVYLLTDTTPKQQFQRVSITTGTSDGINIEVKSGLDEKALLRGAQLNAQR